MAQIYQEVIAITISKLVADRETETSQLVNDGMVKDIENQIEALFETAVVVEAAKIEDE